MPRLRNSWQLTVVPEQQASLPWEQRALLKCLQLMLPLHVLQEAVRAGVERAIELLQRRELSRQSIRAGALAMAAQFRATLNAELQRIF
jgi:hypothetical protein